MSLLYIFLGVFIAFTVTFGGYLDMNFLLQNMSIAAFIILLDKLLRSYRISHHISIFSTVLIFVLVSFFPLSIFYASIVVLIIFMIKKSNLWVWKRSHLSLLILGVIPVSSYFLNYNSPAMVQNLFSNTFHVDTLFHATIAESYKELWVPSTFLMGDTVKIHYHTLSHFFFSRIAVLFGKPALEVYVYTNTLIISSLCIYAIYLLFQRYSRNHYILTLILFLVFYKFSILDFYALGAGKQLSEFYLHFLSESFNLSLFFLPILLLELHRFTKWHYKNFLFAFLLLFLISGSKISVGFLVLFYSGYIGYYSFYRKEYSIPKTLILYLGFLIVFYTSYLLFNESGGQMSWAWNYYYKHWGYGYPYLGFLIYNYPVVLFLVLLILFFPGSRVRHFHGEILFVILTSLVSFLFLNIEGIASNGAYFSMVLQFIPLLVLARLFPYRIVHKRYKWKWNLVMLITLASLISFGTKDLYTRYKTIRTNGQVVSVKQANEYIALLHSIRKNYANKLAGEDKNLRSVVYIPKSEIGYWKNANNSECWRSSYLITAHSGLPAIYGLISNENCQSKFYGLKSYSEDDFIESNYMNYNNQEVCKKLQSIRYNSFYRIENVQAEFVDCRG